MSIDLFESPLKVVSHWFQRNWWPDPNCNDFVRCRGRRIFLNSSQFDFDGISANPQLLDIFRSLADVNFMMAFSPNHLDLLTSAGEESSSSKAKLHPHVSLRHVGRLRDCTSPHRESPWIIFLRIYYYYNYPRQQLWLVSNDDVLVL